MIKTFVFLGLHGAGKGMQADFLNKKTGYPIISTGGELRKIVKDGKFIGKKVAEVMNSGELMPSWFVSYIFQHALISFNEEDGIIFEGAVRKVEEARFFAEVCEWLGRDYRILHLKVSEETVAERLSKRRDIEGRADDDPSVFETRLKNFYEHTAHSLEYFRSINKVIDIDGEPLPEEVFAEIWQKISVL
ncbi:MAG: hypothetical protein CO183_01865 [Candidatus Zambryskibacteria bacterium CG_4_9_14_3_um_filter_42_9]|uniref:Adenylate kinase n=1 Tax=Candidatus Zambryskibacteria bacterium CG22_combo_CG10-13_8_21_14_all_42_17 TaxID=1975118 RepID=A0A2H0BDP7_9BACT|nr:MAG: hypothetical protein COX06_01650 [Candidatus Zambryskibacteria bacterium CG22_combo_CG10-13_8_21_14_all_42_17]PJA36732.1 MAG: hypothetical protein CO183_01865 [Candidatus Zambryskibacteria bacterium CG_4_9_14_3_um_filter_42_9]